MQLYTRHLLLGLITLTALSWLRRRAALIVRILASVVTVSL